MVDKLLEIENLNVMYQTDDGTSYAVNGIDLCIVKGETLGIVGETGAGKTTTALSIMGLLPKVGKITEGSIKFEGGELLSKSEREMQQIRGQNISMIFQDPMDSLNPVITVADQIKEVLELHHRCNQKEIDAKVDEILNLVGISVERKNEYPYQFSGGMKQRVVIAIALACNPNLLLADEPTTALDVTIQAQILDLIERLKKRLNMSVLLITHDLGVVAQTCDSVVAMYAGEIIEQGNVKDIFEGDAHHPYLKGLFGSLPDLSVSSRRLSPIPGLMPDPSNLPRGCKFHPRCPHCMDICKEEQPKNVYNGEHMIKCHLFM